MGCGNQVYYIFPILEVEMRTGAVVNVSVKYLGFEILATVEQ